MKKKLLGSYLAQEQSFALAVPAIMWQFIFLYIPLAAIVAVSVLKRVEYPFLTFLTLDHYSQLFQTVYVTIIVRSLLLAITNGFLCLAIAYPVAYYLAFRVQRFKDLLLFLLIVPFWGNFLAQVYAWFFLLGRQGLLNSALVYLGIVTEPLHILNTPLAVHIVMIFCYLPFMIIPIYNSLEKLDRKLLEASADLGANHWITLRRVTWPLSMAGVETGFMLVFIPSFGEFVIPTLLGGGKQMYVGSLISHYFLQSRHIFLGSAFTCLSGVVLIIAVICIRRIFRVSISTQGS